MTDEMRAYEKAICEVAKVSDIGEVSDGFHTFNGLYEQRMILFAALVKAYKDKAWKSYRHEDGEWCFGGRWFVVGIDTPEGSYTYHYENKYWDMFDCIDLPRAPHWDGHTGKDVTRLLSLPSAQPYTINSDGRLWITVDDIDKVTAVVVDEHKSKFCKQFYVDAEPEQRWISCKQQLPEVGKTILICDIDGNIYVGHRAREHWWSVDDKVKNVIAWMPRPMPYKERWEE